MQNLGFETLSTVLVPGLILFVAFCLAIDMANPELQLTLVANKLAGVEWQASLLALVASTFLGALLASLLGFAEGYILEPLNARRVGCSDPEAEWDAYVDSLEGAHNSYISRIVFFYFFEFRAGSAALILGPVLLCWSPTAAYPVIGVVTFLTGAYLVFAAVHDHHSLTEFRHRRFRRCSGVQHD